MEQTRARCSRRGRRCTNGVLAALVRAALSLRAGGAGRSGCRSGVGGGRATTERSPRRSTPVGSTLFPASSGPPTCVRRSPISERRRWATRPPVARPAGRSWAAWAGARARSSRRGRAPGATERHASAWLAACEVDGEAAGCLCVAARSASSAASALSVPRSARGVVFAGIDGGVDWAQRYGEGARVQQRFGDASALRSAPRSRRVATSRVRGDRLLRWSSAPRRVGGSRRGPSSPSRRRRDGRAGDDWSAARGAVAPLVDAASGLSRARTACPRCTRPPRARARLRIRRPSSGQAACLGRTPLASMASSGLLSSVGSRRGGVADPLRGGAGRRLR